MPSTNKTTNYALNQWSGNEYPKRTDFVQDNIIIDGILKKHEDAISENTSELAAKAKQVDLDTTNANVALRATISDLNATNIEVDKKLNRDEIGTSSYPLDIADWTYLFANLPTASTTNKGGWLYCTDGDGTHGAGKYYSNGTSWYYGGTGDEGYNITNKNMGDLTKSILFGDAVYANEVVAITKSGVTINTSTRTITIPSGTDGSGAGLILKFKAPKKFNSGDTFRLVMLWDTNCYNYFQHVFGIYTVYGFTLSNATFDKISENKYLTIFDFVATSNIPYLSDLAYRITKNQYAFSGNAYMTITSACLYADGLKNYQYDLYNRVVKNNPVISSTSNLPVSDLNNSEINSVYTIAVSGVTVDILANAPFYPFQGIIYTFGIIGVDNIRYQVVKSAVGNNTYYRTMWGSWTSWKMIYNNDITFEYLENGLYTSFLKVGCIGDSLASGESYSNETGTLRAHDIYQHSWGQYMARMSGNTYYNFSNGGLTTRTFLSEQWMSVALDGNHDCTAYIIGLGVNDAGSTYHVDLGSISDIDVNNYNNNADTYYGNYAKIIQMLKEHNSKVHFFVLTNPLSNDSYNTAVRTISTIFNNVHLIDLYTDYRALYESGSFIAQNIRANHYNAIAYNYMAKILANAMCKLMYNNPDKFDQVEFIDTAYSYTA